MPSNPEPPSVWRLSAQVSIRRTDLCAFEPGRALNRKVESLGFQSVERICVPSNSQSAVANVVSARFQSVERICVPSNVEIGVERQRSPTFQSVERICVPSNAAAAVIDGRLSRFNPSNGFVCLRTRICARARLSSRPFQSVERICVPSNSSWRSSVVVRWRFQSVERICVPSNHEQVGVQPVPGIVSIRRTDLCAFELDATVLVSLIGRFQSVERICVPSNTALMASTRRFRPSFNPSNGFVCLRTAASAGPRHRNGLSFNPSNGFVCLRTRSGTALNSASFVVSIRRTDLCAFERRWAVWWMPGTGCSFNPSNGFVCLRTGLAQRAHLGRHAAVSIRRTDLCAFEPGNTLTIAVQSLSEFQSVERICVPSNSASPLTMIASW